MVPLRRAPGVAGAGLAPAGWEGSRASADHRRCVGRPSTAGNLAFPFTPPEVSLGPAYRFNVYYLLRTPDPDALFPLEIEAL